MLLLSLACSKPAPAPVDLDQRLAEHCAEMATPRVEEVAEGVHVALFYDLANTTVFETPDGRVVVDPGMSPSRAREARAALDEVTSGPVTHVVYTHSHIDHVGGATVWVEEGTEVWATTTFQEHFFEQYSELLPSEARRGARQFGRDVPDAALPCSALGRRVDLDAVLELGVVMPTNTFDGHWTLPHGIELFEAHGETHDQLFVYRHDGGVLLPGDNWYAAFPNLYTIRGTKPRPVDDWIDSLDEMRAKDPRVLVPSHTAPVREPAQALTAYRDGIQWVRDAVLRGANAGVDIDTLAATIELPPHLASEPALAELYGSIPWSVRAIYSSEVGWFDEQTADLYPLPPDELRERTVTAMGGADEVLAMAREADDPRWALHLYGLVGGHEDEVADRYEELAESQANTNGRGWLLQSAHELRSGRQVLGQPELSSDFVQGLPLDQMFSVMALRLKADDALEVHESVRWEFTDKGVGQVTLTIRNGVSEARWGEPLPGTPEPVAVIHASAETWRRVALQLVSPSDADLEVEGSLPGLLLFLSRFDRGLPTE
ncbi:MAG: MBL fold metallo-hydrolase [Proteobacteria bacterium]|nr:MBL fold metallo-hydrolase [Pseudomonadota bacterium]